ncbi:MAG: hypothetical protein AMJ55_00295 [Gammaproteobacteria bacterium SG8_15]|nr:MAG: hypothetical protein AMJ55_00295 [Gammaproteobacteria bacterium SG8_15]
MKTLTQDEKYVKYYQASREVLVDFDGTLCEFQYPDFGPPRRGAKAFMEWLTNKGLRPVVWSSRLSREYALNASQRAAIAFNIRNWLERYDFHYYDIDTGELGKRLALAYVDDRGVAAGPGTTWAAARKRINEIHRREMARWEEHNDSST